MTSPAIQEAQWSELTLDANVLLAELDKGLRSPHGGEQCEAIVRFPWLFERYPFPILINSACLKLAEVFRAGSNFCRLLVLRVLEQTRKHLAKISNSTEFVRRIFSVSYSNDPVARAITLRTLGAIASITSDRKDIHHYIRDSLDSRDDVEAAASIDGAAAFANESLDFALNICPKILSMLRDPIIPLEAKTRLLSVLHHPHYDSKVALEVRNECLQLLSTYSHEEFICSVLHTLTYVSSASMSLIPEQVWLLLNHLKTDHRSSVKRKSLIELKSLAESAPHLWTQENIAQLVHSSRPPKNAFKSCDHLLLAQIKVLSLICKSPCMESGGVSSETSKLVMDTSLRISRGNYSIQLKSYAFEIMSQICGSGLLEDHKLKDAVDSIKLFIIQTPCESSVRLTQEDKRNLQKILRLIVPLSRNQDMAQELITSLQSSLMSADLSDFWVTSICQTMCALDYSCIAKDLHMGLNLLIESRSTSLSDEALVSILTLNFQMLAMMDKEAELNLRQVLQNRNLWTCFRVLRSAMKYGHATSASNLSAQLIQGSSSETSHFYLMSLDRMCRAEAALADQKLQVDVRLSRAVALYVESLSNLRAAVTPANPLSFQSEYLSLRLKLLQVHEMLRQSCQLVRTAPAPAIAASVAITSRDDLMKHGTIVHQMRKCAKELRNLSDGFSSLFQGSFNADDPTLSHLQLLQSSCTIVAEAVESLFQANRVSSLFVDDHTHLEKSRLDSDLPSPQHRRLIAACKSVSSSVAQHLSNRRSAQIDCSQIKLLQTIGTDLLSVPLCVPRFFFQSVQSVSVKLAISPQPKSMGELITVPAQSQFALRVEGVIVSGRSVGRLNRSVCKIKLQITTCALNKGGSEAGSGFIFGKPPADLTISSSCVVVPKNDYFQSQFLLNLTAPGIHNITVEASIIDENEAQWKTGPVLCTSVKVLEEVRLVGTQ